MYFLEDVVILEVFGGSSLELFDVGACAEGFLDFAEKKNDFDIIGCFMWSYGWGEIGAHILWECVEIWGAVEVDVSYFILDFGLYFVEVCFM